MRDRKSGRAAAAAGDEDPFFAFRRSELRLRAIVGETSLVTFLFGGFVFHRLMADERLRAMWPVAILCLVGVAIVMAIVYLRVIRPRLDQASERANDVLKAPLDPRSERGFREGVLPIVWKAPLLGFAAMLSTVMMTALCVVCGGPGDLETIVGFVLPTLAYGAFVAAISSLETARTMLFVTHVVHLTAWRRPSRPPRNTLLRLLERAAFLAPPALGPFVLASSFVAVSLFGLDTHGAPDAFYKTASYVMLAVCPFLTGLMIYVGEQVEISGRDITMLQAFIGCEPRHQTSHVAFESFLRAAPVKRGVLEFLRPLVDRQLHLAVHSARAVRDALAAVGDDVRSESPSLYQAVQGTLDEAKAKVSLFEEYPKRLEALFRNWFRALARPPKQADFLRIVQARVRRLEARHDHVRLDLSGVEHADRVLCDAPSAAIKLMIDSLLENACVATRHLAERVPDTEPLVMMTISLQSDGFVALDVLDKGTGLLPSMKSELEMARDVLDRRTAREDRPSVAFFEAAVKAGQPYPFVWNKRTVGLGLGLYFVDAIVTAYGGGLHVDASPPRPWSTRARINLPCQVVGHVGGRQVSNVQKAPLEVPLRAGPVGMDPARRGEADRASAQPPWKVAEVGPQPC